MASRSSSRPRGLTFGIGMAVFSGWVASAPVLAYGSPPTEVL